MKRIFTIMITSVVCVLYLTSCIDDEYDLNKDINQDINVGGDSLSLPIGTTDTIVLSELFDFEDDDEFIQALENGNYSISYKDSADIKGVKIKPVSIGAITPSINSINIDFVSPISFAYNIDEQLRQNKIDVKFKIPVGEEGLSAKIVIKEVIAPEIEKLVSVDMLGESGVALEVSVAFTLPDGFDEVRLDQFTIDFPNIFEFKEELEIIDNKRIKFVSNDIIEGVSGVFTFEKTFYLTSLELGENNQYVVDGEDGTKYFTLGDSINITGGIIVPVDPASLPQLGSINCAPFVKLGEMNFSKVEGIFSPTIDPISDAFEFDGLPDFLQGDGVNLDFINPVVKFQVSNTLDIPMIANAVITPMRKGEPQTEKRVKADLNIRPASESILSKFWLSEIDEGRPSGWDYVDATISLLLEQIPDSLNIEVGIKTDKTKGSHIIDLTETYDLKVNYEVDVPLTLGDKFKINYLDTIKDIGEDLEDVIDKITSLSLDIEATNSVPLNLALLLMPVDKEFKSIDGIDVNIPDVINAGKTGTGIKSELTVKLKETKEGALAKLYHFVLSIGADTKNSTADGVTLNKDQYLILKLKARIEGGITIDLDE